MSRATRLIPLVLLALLAPGAAAASRVAPTADQARPLLIGQSAPDAEVLDLDGKPVSLAGVFGDKQSVVVFIRGGWCPYCNKQLSQLQKSLDSLTRLNYQVIAISPDTPEQMRGFREEKGLKFTIFSDPTGEAAKKFGLAYAVGPKDFGGAGMFASWQQAGPRVRTEAPFLPLPAVYLVTRSRTIFYQYVNINIAVRLSAEVLLTAARVYGAR